MVKEYNVAVVGATGMVGQAMANLLYERNFPYKNLKLLASSRSANSSVNVGGREYRVEETSTAAFAGIDFAFFSVEGDLSKQLAPEAVKQGAVVIDNSSAFRLDEGVPLVVPEVNPKAVSDHKGIISNPNCSTIQMVVAINPLHRVAGIKRLVVSTYQAVSGAGREAMEELSSQSRNVLEQKEIKAEYIPHKGAAKQHQIAFNVVPQLDVMMENGYCKEEMKMINETKKIMGMPDFPVNATTVRVPVMNGHSEAVNLELEDELSPDKARNLLKEAPGVVLMDDTGSLTYPMPVDISGKDEVYVGRIRKDDTVKYGLNLWVVADNLRKGAATNSVQIAELLV